MVNVDPGSSLEAISGDNNEDRANMARYVCIGYKVDLRRTYDYDLRGLSKSWLKY